MKVIKRDGRTIDFDRSKIQVAIEKANKEVRGKERATKDEIDEIISYIMDLGKKRMLVEDIQDVIEEKLMEFDKYELAKKYIVYRYTRALVRKSNTTDESILGLIRNENKELAEENSNKNTMLASTQRDYIAGEVSRDLTKRILLPEKISKAHEEGILHFHDADYFVQPIFNCCLINIGDMLDNGTAMNGKMIESPKSFQVACTVTTQIIAAVASNQYGGQSVDMKHLGKYLRRSHDKVKKKNNLCLFKNFFFFSKYYLVLLMFILYGLIASTLNHFSNGLVDESILTYDRDLNGVTGEIYFQGIAVPSTTQHLESIQENLQVFAEVNYTHLFSNPNEGFFINQEKITTLYPMHEHLSLKEGTPFDIHQEKIQIYVNECFANQHHLSLPTSGYLQYISIA